eukprot:CAMPEP_0116855504 /NCGR_PEP_ID=MMETSP0418-20121206/19321_1 /TAXON_ID=1158023 /ORGANISM="Astrosyne radiata, Strain 13vi08-1A" /LENGTH=197 /DNA_ID=CAMNT_0004488657 /DNA_START=64 /DNA_END=656 /DNA_ORIENTATION=-
MKVHTQPRRAFGDVTNRTPATSLKQRPNNDTTKKSKAKPSEARTASRRPPHEDDQSQKAGNDNAYSKQKQTRKKPSFDTVEEVELPLGRLFRDQIYDESDDTSSEISIESLDRFREDIHEIYENLEKQAKEKRKKLMEDSSVAIDAQLDTIAKEELLKLEKDDPVDELGTELDDMLGDDDESLGAILNQLPVLDISF